MDVNRKQNQNTDSIYMTIQMVFSNYLLLSLSWDGQAIGMLTSLTA